MYHQYCASIGHRRTLLHRKGIGAEVSRGVRLYWQSKIRFVLLSHQYAESYHILHNRMIFEAFCIGKPCYFDERVIELKKKTVFTGVATALITPVDEHGINYDEFGRLIDWQIAEGVNALCICGTTGESSTLTDAEHRQAIHFAIERVNHRIPVIAGTGSNDTAYAVELTKAACAAGADAVLVVTPYYNKTSQAGLVKMYTTIADASSVPLILYNVPSRTGVNIEPETYLKLAEHPMISGIKEASGNISGIATTAALVQDKLDIYSGNDDEIVPIMSLGGKGVISVLSNVLPKKTVEICNRFFQGDVAGARELQLELLPLIHALFSEVNPIPVKAAMAKMGFCKNYLRLPLVEMNKEKEAVLFERMKEQGVI